MFKFSSVKGDRSSGSNYLHQLQREIKTKVKGPTRTDNGGGSAAWNALEKALRALHARAQLIPPLRSAIDGLISILGVFEATARAHKEYEQLASNLVATIEMLEQHLKSSNSTKVNDKILEISSLIEEQVLSIHNRQGFNRISAALEDEFTVLSYRQIEMLFCHIQASTILNVEMSVLMTANEHLENDRLENINPAKLANYNSILSTEISRRGCTENTRNMILSNLYQWSNDPTSKIMNWMIGMAGTGKTTIAYTLSAVLDSREKLAASFFCTHLSPECRDVGRIIPTLAYQLARKSTTFRPTLCRVLEQNPDIAFQDIPTQFRHLLQEPLQELGQKLPNNLVMVIDALDECEDAKAVGQLLTVLFKHAATIPVRFFITSRPELRVATLLQNESEKLKICSTSQLHEIERSTVQHDIETYLKEELAFMDPSPYDIQRLAEASGQLFIYAATAVRYIRPGVMVVDHHERLATMLGVNSTSQKRLAHLDALYSTILSTALDNVELETDERDRILQVLRTVVCLREPVHLETLKVFTGLRDVKQTLIALQPLRSVIYVSEKNNYVSVLHQSFPEYILEPEHFNKFSCDYREHNQLLARRCFNLMKDGLVFNICGLESLFIPDKDVVDIKERIVNNIPDSLAYACRYWGDHIELVDRTYEILNDVDDFLDQRLLFWMEVLNLNECIAVGVGALLKLQSWLAEFRVFISPSFLARASDASNFVASFAAQPVSLSTPHIYISALSLASGSSYVTRHYRARINGIPRGVAISSTQETGPLPPGMQHTSIPRFTRPGAYISSTLDQHNPAFQDCNAEDSTAHMSHQYAYQSADMHSTPYHPVPPSYSPTRNGCVTESADELRSTPLIDVRVIHTTPQVAPHGFFSLTPPSQPQGTSNPFDSEAPSFGDYDIDEFYRNKSVGGQKTTSPSMIVQVPIQRSVKVEIKRSAQLDARSDEESGQIGSVYEDVNDVMRDQRGPKVANPRGADAVWQWDLSACSFLNYPWEFRSDGWILNRNGGFLFFIPPEKNELFRGFKSHNGSWQSILSGVDWGMMYLGDQWTKCYMT